MYIKDKLVLISGQVISIIFIGVVLKTLNATSSLIALTCSSLLFVGVVSLVMDFLKRRSYYKNIYDILDGMHKKQYIFSLIPNPHFSDARVMWDILRQTTKAMNDEIAIYQIKNEEYREYIETWIHEIKLPISGISLLCDNNKNDVTLSILEENDRIEAYVEQALYYARSTNVEKDYSIRTVSLDKVVKSTVKRHSKQLIAIKTHISMGDLNHIVYTDSKWLEFILGQIISNSIKYKKDELSLYFDSSENENGVTLTISDNGIGIPEQDINRVFEKGFTGDNGRQFAKSTGIGLYLCMLLCDKMCLGLTIESEIRRGTTIKIYFPKEKYILLS